MIYSLISVFTGPGHMGKITGINVINVRSDDGWSVGSGPNPSISCSKCSFRETKLTAALLVWYGTTGNTEGAARLPPRAPITTNFG
jgi:hypothetical protein